MNYSRLTLLQVPLLYVMEWASKKPLAEIYQGSFILSDSLQLTDAVDDEENELQPAVAHKRARKSGSRRGGKTAWAFLGSPRERRQAVGIRSRRQAQPLVGFWGDRVVVEDRRARDRFGCCS